VRLYPASLGHLPPSLALSTLQPLLTTLALVHEPPVTAQVRSKSWGVHGAHPLPNVKMAARSRPRGGQRTDEYDEERVIWNSIKQDGRRVDQLLVRYIHFHRHQSIVVQGFRQHQYLQDSTWTIPPKLRDSEGYRGHDRLNYDQYRDDPEERKIWNKIRKDGRRADALLVWCIAPGSLHAYFRDAHILLRVLANVLQKDSDGIQEKILVLVSEQKDRISTSTTNCITTPLSS
jgi:hypothetical protein